MPSTMETIENVCRQVEEVRSVIVELRKTSLGIDEEGHQAGAFLGILRSKLDELIVETFRDPELGY